MSITRGKKLKYAKLSNRHVKNGLITSWTLFIYFLGWVCSSKLYLINFFFLSPFKVQTKINFNAINRINISPTFSSHYLIYLVDLPVWPSSWPVQISRVFFLCSFRFFFRFLSFPEVLLPCKFTKSTNWHQLLCIKHKGGFAQIKIFHSTN